MIILNEAGIKGMGWIPDRPDDRDYTPATEAVRVLLTKSIKVRLEKVALPESVDLRALFPNVFFQGATNSCTAQAAAAVIAYFEQRAFGKSILPSRMFIYRATRDLLHQPDDRGALIRTTVESLVLFGAPPEEYWPFAPPSIDVEPPAFCYAFGEKYRAITYYRYEEPNQSKEDLLLRIKSNLAVGLPSIFGFYLFPSVQTSQQSGEICMPSDDERPVGGHAVVAVGYDNNITIKHPVTGLETVGAVLIRNSWGEQWGQKGYGWLPYEYVLRDLATDWWSIVKSNWLDTNRFSLQSETEQTASESDGERHSRESKKGQ